MDEPSSGTNVPTPESNPPRPENAEHLPDAPTPEKAENDLATKVQEEPATTGTAPTPLTASVVSAPEVKKGSKNGLIPWIILAVVVLLAAGLIAWLLMQKSHTENELSTTKKDLASTQASLATAQKTAETAQGALAEQTAANPTKSEDQQISDAMVAWIQGQTDNADTSASDIAKTVSITKKQLPFATVNVSATEGGYACLLKQSNDLWVVITCGQETPDKSTLTTWGVPDGFYATTDS